jgi:hypothetical protein
MAPAASRCRPAPRREGLEPGQEADEEVDDAVVHQEHHAGDGGECCAHHEGERDRAVDIDAEQRRHLHVLLAGALLAAERSRGDDPGEARHQRHRHHDDDDLQPGDAHVEAVGAEQGVAALDDRARRLGPRTLRQLHVVLQQDRHADRRDQRRELEGAAQWPIGGALDGPAVDGGEGHGHQQDQQDGDRRRADAQRAADHEADQRDEGADHEDFAVREVDHADDAVDHRVADGDQAVDGAQRDGVDELL